ncbi:MAG: hypothetical protein DRJ38_05490 [Thermoprotei archaeon]|nr:MAG: hypothetical protein DRJ38_05490 [Thermoprotei archaeon]
MALDKWLTGEDKVFVFDIDGVLIDVGEKVKAVLKELKLNENLDPRKLDVVNRQKFWRLFLSEKYARYDKPRIIGIELLKDRLNKGKVVIVTGRPETLKQLTLEELLKWNIPIHKLTFIFRRKRDRRRDVDFKIEAIANLGNVVEVHDDAEEFLKKVKEIFPKIKLYLHFDDKFIEY